MKPRDAWILYLAFVLTTVRRLLMGSDFRYLVMSIVALSMVGIPRGAFVLKRIKLNSIVQLCLAL